ncbi:MAG: MurR/RpiR family transcriptional regulator [Anaerolineales bacterium]|nr:MurR/RpiR family transcriptional regulator [Anaerolineales bacterium]
MAATYAERIHAARPGLSKSFQRLADYILDSYVQTALMTASELAHAVDVDSATVVRFAQALDYSGFPELQAEIKARVIQDLMLRPKESARADSLPGLTDTVFKELGDAMERRRRMLDPVPLEALLAALKGASRVLILADAQGRFIVPELRRVLSSVGILCQALPGDEDGLARSLATAGEQDFLLVIDLKDQAAHLPAALAQAKAAGLLSAALVGSASHTAAQRAGIVIEVQSQEQSDNAPVVLSALVYTLGRALRWRYAEDHKQVQSKTERTLKRLAAARAEKAK